MNQKSKRVLTAWLFPVIMLLVDSALGAGTVSEIRITGNKKVEADAILNAIKLRKGDSWTEESIASEIRILFGLGYFSDLRISK